MRIIIEIKESELELKRAIVLGWNKKYGEKLTPDRIKEVKDKDDILSAIPYLEENKIKIIGIEE